MMFAVDTSITVVVIDSWALLFFKWRLFAMFSTHIVAILKTKGLF